MSDGRSGELSDLSREAVSKLPGGYGDAVRLFRAIDEQQAEEDISPTLATTLRDLFVVVEKQKPGTLEDLAIRGHGGIRYAATQLEEGLIEMANALQAGGKGSAGEIISEYMGWVTTDEQPKAKIKFR
jgi:hypothetical protein